MSDTRIKRRKVLEERHAKVRKLQNKLAELTKAKWNLGYIKLKKPLRNGYYKHLVLRDDIARRKDAHVIEEILSIAGTSNWGRDKKHVDKVWKKYNSENKEIHFPGIRKLNQRQYDKLSEKAKRLFRGLFYTWNPWQGNVMRYYCTIPRYYFKLAYSKAYITKRQIIDPELNSQIKQIENQLMKNEYYALSWYGGSMYRKWESKLQHRRLRRSVKVALNQYNELLHDQITLHE